MRLFIIEPDVDTLELLGSRIKESLRQAGIRRVEIVSGNFDLLTPPHQGEMPFVVFLGPTAHEAIDESIEHVRAVFPNAPIGIVLDNETYALEAISLRRSVQARIMPIADIAQMAQFMLDAELLASTTGIENQGICMVAQLKGGVGASTIAAGLGACWAQNGLSVALVDLDDVNPQLTDWGRVGASQRKVISELLRSGEVPGYRLNEVTTGIEGYEGQLAVVGQPERYQESFQYKADIIEGVPSASRFIESLLKGLREKYDVVVVDAGRSWGIATFATLPLCQHVLMVTDDDGMSLRRTMDNLRRFYRESDDQHEFSLSRWSIVFNGYTGRLLSPSDVNDEVEDQGIFPDSTQLFTIPFSERGRQWGAPGESFYDLAEENVKNVIRNIAFSLIPFRRTDSEGSLSGLKRRIQEFVGL